LISKDVLRSSLAAGLLSAVVLIFSGAAGAAEVGIFRLDSRDEIVTGEADGTAIGPLGQIELGFALERIASFEEPFLLSAAPIPGGGFLVGSGNQGRVFKVDAKGKPASSPSWPRARSSASSAARTAASSPPARPRPRSTA
jgi:hypothetical protein